MRRYQLKTVIASLLLVTFFITSCSKNSVDEPNYLTTTLEHQNGFDFSEGSIPADWSVSDGYVASWQPDSGNSTTYPNNAGNFWWITHTPATTNTTKDMGKVTMSSVTQAPTSWEVAPNIIPLQIDHIYVAKCNDGYVKFKVLSIDADNWEADVEYSFSETAAFSE